MSLHPTFPAGLERGEAVARIRAALGHMLPLNAVRIVSDDELAIEDDGGNDWMLQVRAPQIDDEPELVADTCAHCGEERPAGPESSLWTCGACNGLNNSEPDEQSDDWCPNPDGHRHDWPCVEEHERCLCTYCGADGDA